MERFLYQAQIYVRNVKKGHIVYLKIQFPALYVQKVLALTNVQEEPNLSLIMDIGDQMNNQIK